MKQNKCINEISSTGFANFYLSEMYYRIPSNPQNQLPSIIRTDIQYIPIYNKDRNTKRAHFLSYSYSHCFSHINAVCLFLENAKHALISVLLPALPFSFQVSDGEHFRAFSDNEQPAMMYHRFIIPTVGHTWLEFLVSEDLYSNVVFSQRSY